MTPSARVEERAGWQPPGHASDRQRSGRAVVLVGAVYGISGIALGALAGMAPSGQMRVLWRLAAWAISAAAFGAHIGYAHARLRHAPLITARDSSLAVAVGALTLAVAANAHALWTGAGNHRLLGIALLAWPVLTAIPAFAVALASATVLTSMRRRT